jgi:hypothetical protein
MTTDDLIPPPPRVVLDVEEIVLCHHEGKYSQDNMRQLVHNLSRQFEDTAITLKVGQARFTYRNGYERT